MDDRHDAYRLALTDALRGADDPVEAQAVATRVLGDHLGASRVMYGEADPGSETFHNHREYRRDQAMPTALGEHRWDEFGAYVATEMRAGRTLVVDEVRVHPGHSADELAAYEAVGVGAYVAVPLVREGRIVAYLAVNHTTPRAWTAAEIALIEETAERTWGTVERARAEAALRASEEKYRALFEQMDEAYAVVEVIADAAGRWIDFRFLEVNPAFMRHTGMPYPVGRTATELLGTPNPRWAEYYGRAADTGVSMRVEDTELALGRTFELNIFRLGGVGSRRVAVLFTDITERKRAEEDLRRREERQRYLVRLGDALRPLADPVTIQGEAMRVLGEHLGSDRAYYVEVDALRGEDVVEREGRRDGVASHAGRFPVAAWPMLSLASGRPWVVRDVDSDSDMPDDQRASYQANDIGACVVVPFLENGQLIATLVVNAARPRDWTAAEIELLEDTAERTGSAVERARAEAALRQSETRYRTLFETMGQGCCELELLRDAERRAVDQRYLTFNPAFERIFGISVERAQGRKASEVFPGLDPWWHESFDRIARAGHPERIEYEVAALGRWYELWVYPRGGDRLTVLYEDVTDRKHAAEELRRSESRLRAVLEQAPLAIVFTGSSGDIVFRNAMFDALWGRPAHTATARTYSDVYSGYHLDGRPVASEEWPGARAVLKGEVIEDEVYEIVQASGDRITCGFTAGPIRDEAGEIVGGVVMFRDVTDERRTHEALRASEEALKENDRRKDEFLAMLGHELRNPLAPIRTVSTLLDQELGTRPEFQPLLGVLARQTMQLTRLVDDLLDVARITHARVALKFESVECGAVIDQAIETVRALAAEKSHQLRIHRPDEKLYVSGDRARLVQTVTNLLNNAIKYTDPHGTITLAVSTTEHELVLSVQDTGVGISAELLPHVFDLFVQSERSLDRSQGGLGIGLSVARHLVGMHHGTLQAHSAGPGQGSTFEIRLPRIPTPNRVEEAVVTPGAPRRILVVDDNQDAADMLALLLTSDGHDVDVVYRSTDVLAHVAQQLPDVVLLDLGMPDMDGYAVVRALRSHHGNALRVIALTGYGAPEDRERTRAAGFDAHLVKPVDVRTLRGHLAR